MLTSMTGFAAGKGALAPFSWTWDLRSVNAKGLDLRVRVPDWLPGLETALRGELAKSVARGNITLSLRLTRDDTSTGAGMNTSLLAIALDALVVAEAEAQVRGLTLAPSSGADLLHLRGMLEPEQGEDDHGALIAQLRAEFPALVAEFVQMRQSEGAALTQVLSGQLDQIADLTAQAASLAEARKQGWAETLKTNLERVLADIGTVDPDRLAQELALIAVKTDVTEEIDRLGAHIAAARDLIATQGSVGRKLDFLMQEFNREANTLCSKSQNAELTAVGLALKAVIDQMREQVQNVE